MSEELSDNVKKAALLEVVKRITVEEGDILVVRAENPADLEALGDVIANVHRMNVVIIEEGSIDVLRDLSDEELKGLGLMRIPPEEQNVPTA